MESRKEVIQHYAKEVAMHTLNNPIVDLSILHKHYIFRHGYVFTSISNPANIFDTIVIRNPGTADCWTPQYGFSEHSLSEHIDLINHFGLEKAVIIAEDINFILQCPSLKYVKVIPADTSNIQFDYSPLYDMPCLEQLICITTYGGSSEPYSTSLDYARIFGLRNITVSGKGHINYNSIDTLDTLSIQSDKMQKNLLGLQCFSTLKDLSFLQCGIESLRGIATFCSLQRLDLSYNRTLHDISELRYTADSLRALRISNCPRITDFSCLEGLINLEHLELTGKNKLVSLQFLHNMKKLKTFVFSMDIQDGDLSPCFQIPYACALKNKKHYNFRDKDLPKHSPQQPFRFY